MDDALELSHSNLVPIQDPVIELRDDACVRVSERTDLVVQAEFPGSAGVVSPIRNGNFSS